MGRVEIDIGQPC